MYAPVSGEIEQGHCIETRRTNAQLKDGVNFMLPGKLCIGILEEDNPQKSYFRLKPLLVESEGRYEAVSSEEAYPEEGCIRIVPDKNESSYFKGRMRRMGRYCVLDLRDHAGENDKIRPNKNYKGDDVERNAHIVYSDVVREPARDMIFEIAEFEGEGAWEGDAPGTPRVLRGSSTETWAYAPADGGDEGARIAPDGQSLNEAELQRFELPGFPGETLRFAIRLPGTLPSVVEPPIPRAELLRAERSTPKPEERPAPKPEEKAAPEPPAAEKAAPEKPAPERPAPERPVQEKPAPEKPWISHDLPKPPHIDPRMSRMQQSLAAQSGLNPRRNRSLQEIIEEKWRHSRVDQLGHPIPANAMGQPVENPVERAVEALRQAWDNPAIHAQLLDAISSIGDFYAALDQRGRMLGDHAIQQELEELEADRLRALDALDKLRREKAALRESFKEEIRQEEAGALAEAVARTKAAQAECKKYEAEAERARKSMAEVEDAYASLTDGRFEDKLRDFALTSRAAALLKEDGAAEAAPNPVDPAPSREEWMQRIKRAFALEGLELSSVQAANMLVCAALGESLLFSGPAASDKCMTAHALATALGAPAAQRYVEFPGESPDVRAPKAEELLRPSDLPAVALIREANRMPGADVCRGLCGAAENLLVIAAISDGGTGFPVSAEALERGFLIRLEPVSADAPWRPCDAAASEFPPVRMQALRDAFLKDAEELPPALERRLQKIRSELAAHGVRLSRRTLDMMWHYCGAMLSACRISAGEALDLAFAQKALPCILAEAPVACLAGLKAMLSGMPHSLSLLNQPLPIQI